MAMHSTTLSCFQKRLKHGFLHNGLGNRLGSVKARLEKGGSGFPRLSGRVGTIRLRPVFIAKRVGSVWIRFDFDPLVMFSRRSAQPVQVMIGYPVILTGLVIEDWAEEI